MADPACQADREPLALPAPSPVARVDGWTPERQRAFLEALAETGVVRTACDACGLSARSAYNLRFRGQGAAFRLGWDAAVLIARARLADELMMRAIEGQEEVLTRDEDGIVTRRRHDNRLAMSLLSRLDRWADACPESGSDAALARLVAQDFEAFLDLVGSRAETGGAAASAALFLAARRPGLAAENRADERCELHPGAVDDMAPAPADEPIFYPTPEQAVVELRGVWWCDVHEEMRTDFPPPPGFDGDEELDFGDLGYNRALTEREATAQHALKEAVLAPIRVATAAARDDYFGFAPKRPRKPHRRSERPSPIPDKAPSSAGSVAGPGLCEHIPQSFDNPVFRAEPVWEAGGEPDRAAEPSVTSQESPYRTVRPWPRPATQPGRPPQWAEPLETRPGSA